MFVVMGFGCREGLSGEKLFSRCLRVGFACHDDADTTPGHAIDETLTTAAGDQDVGTE